MLGRFADAQLAGLSDAELDEFERWLEMPDQQMFAWVTGTEPAPPNSTRALFRRLRDFHMRSRPARRMTAQISRRMLQAGTAADARAGRRRRRRLVLADLARASPRAAQAPAISLVRDLPRRPAHGAACRARSPSSAPTCQLLEFPAWDCLPYDRVSPHAGVVAQRMTALSRLARVKGRDRPSVLLTTVNAALQRVPAREFVATPRAVGRARQCHRHGRHRRLAGAQRLHPRLDGARARRICGARRHPRSVPARHGPAGAARFLRRRAGDDPHLRSADASAATGQLRGARSGAGGGIPARHRDHPPLPHRLCRAVRRRHARRSALRGGERRPPLSRHGALAAAVPHRSWRRCSTICRARRWRSSRWPRTPRTSASRRSRTITRRAGRR